MTTLRKVVEVSVTEKNTKGKKSFSHSVCPILSDPMDSNLPDSSVQEIPKQEYWNG